MKDTHVFNAWLLCVYHMTHLRRCSYGSIKLWISLFYHRWFFFVSNFTDFFDFCNFSSLHSQRSHKLNKCDWTDVYQNVAKREIKSDWTKFSNFASIADTPDAGLIFLSPISLWNIWKKRHNQILHIPTVFNRYPQDLRLQVKLIWFLSSIRIVFCCKC